VKSLAGKFIVFDGPDGSGKTTQLELLASHLTSQGLQVVQCKDPGGTQIGERIRHLLLDYDLSQMDAACETLLFMASRAQLVGQVINPAVRDGKVVLCDRFVSATCAYQGAAGYDIKRIIDLAPFAIGDTWPDLTILLDVEVERGFERTGRKPQQTGKRRKQRAGQHSMFADAVTDAMEARPPSFHRKVREHFISLQNRPDPPGGQPPRTSPHNYPGIVTLIETTAQDPAKVHEQVLGLLGECFGSI